MEVHHPYGVSVRPEQVLESLPNLRVFRSDRKKLSTDVEDGMEFAFDVGSRQFSIVQKLAEE